MEKGFPASFSFHETSDFKAGPDFPSDQSKSILLGFIWFLLGRNSRAG
jgi:hypothetical protein